MKGIKLREKDIPTVSVVIPVYNCESDLRQCLESLYNQTCTDIEFIVVDDGSTDGSSAICDEIGLKDDRFHIVHIKNQGVSAARNLGIQLAQGQYIGFVDADDWIEPDTFAYAVSNAKQNNADISIYGYWDVRDEIDYNEKKSFPLQQISHERAFQLINSFQAFDYQVWDKIYKRELFDNLAFRNSIKDEDVRMTTKLLEQANIICYDATPKYHYRHSTTSRSQSREVCLDGPFFARQMLHLVETKYPRAVAYALFRYAVVCVWEYDHILYAGQNNTYLEFCQSFVSILRKRNVVQEMRNIKPYAAVRPYIRKLSLLSLSPALYRIYHTVLRRHHV